MSFRSDQRRLGRSASSAFCFLVIASLIASAQTFNYEEQITARQARLAKARAAHNEQDEPNELIHLGELQADDGLAKIALGTENEALDLCVRLKLRVRAGVAVQDIGWIYSLLEDKKRAVDYYNMGLKVEEADSNFISLGQHSRQSRQPEL